MTRVEEIKAALDKAETQGYFADRFVDALRTAVEALDEWNMAEFQYEKLAKRQSDALATIHEKLGLPKENSDDNS